MPNTMSKTIIAIASRQTITTKYLGPTRKLPARAKATSSGGFTRTIPWDNSVETHHNHRIACMALINQMAEGNPETSPWTGRWVGGENKGGYIFVQANLLI